MLCQCCVCQWLIMLKLPFCIDFWFYQRMLYLKRHRFPCGEGFTYLIEIVYPNTYRQTAAVQIVAANPESWRSCKFDHRFQVQMCVFIPNPLTFCSSDTKYNLTYFLNWKILPQKYFLIPKESSSSVPCIWIVYFACSRKP